MPSSKMAATGKAADIWFDHQWSAKTGEAGLEQHLVDLELSDFLVYVSLLRGLYSRYYSDSSHTEENRCQYHRLRASWIRRH